jgi:hypothetical protein
MVLACAVTVKTAIAPAKHTVFPKFAAGAAHWWAGLPLYTHYEDIGAFRYSPTFAVAMTPFAALGPRIGGSAWAVAGIFLYLLALRAFVRDVLPGRTPPEGLAAVVFLTMFAAIRGVWNAQSNILVASFLLLGGAAVIRQQRWRAGILLAVTVFLKLSPIVAAGLIVVLWPRRLLVPFATALLAGLLIPFLTQSPEYVAQQYWGWYAHLAESSAARWPSFRDGWTVWELFQKPINLPAYRILQVLTGLAALAWCLAQKRAQSTPREALTLTMSLGVAWLLMFGPAIEFNTYILLAPLLSCALLGGFLEKKGRPLIAAAFVLTTFLGAGAVERALTPISVLFTAALPCGTALFVVWLIAYAPSLCRKRAAESA